MLGDNRGITVSPSGQRTLHRGAGVGPALKGFLGLAEAVKSEELIYQARGLD